MSRLTITILGSTGSIGRNTVDIVARRPDLYQVDVLVAHSNATLLAEQALKLKAKYAVIADESHYEQLKTRLAGSQTKAMSGRSAVIEAAQMPTEWVMAAIVGAAGLAPVMEVIKRGAILALANKECLVCGGELVMREIKKHKATLLPVDSEHSAIFQVYDFAQIDKVDKIILTASGGPFRTASLEKMRSVTPAQAVAHPNWSMGAKISVDSATMMNKGLELIEAHHIFGLPEQQIDIVVHPQSVIHSLVSYVDGSTLAQLGNPDMRTPIAYALGWPKRIHAPVESLNLAKVAQLTFEQPDETRFPSLRIVREVLRRGGVYPIVLNAANEIAVAAFLEGKLGFLDITHVIEEALSQTQPQELSSIEDILEQDLLARQQTQAIVSYSFAARA